MRFRLLNLCCVPVISLCVLTPGSAQSSPSRKISKHPSAATSSAIDDGTMVNGIYRNKTLDLSCRVPAGWVLRTEEMNSADDENAEKEDTPSQGSSAQDQQKKPERQLVLLAAFSRPPEARGQDINSSILIAAESTSAYPGLKEAAQYFGPLTEVAKAQGFTVDEEPYEFAVGTRKLVRADFHKDVGTRVMRQSTLAFLSHQYAISITVIGGTDDEVEELIDGVSFAKQ